MVGGEVSLAIEELVYLSHQWALDMCADEICSREELMQYARSIDDL